VGFDRNPGGKRGSDAALPLIPGGYGGHTIDFRAFAEEGITLLGRLQSRQGSTLEFADDLDQSITYGDAAYYAFLDMVDDYVERNKMNLPAEPTARTRLPDPPCITPPFPPLNTPHLPFL